MRDTYGLNQEQLRSVVETAVGGLELPGTGSESATPEQQAGLKLVHLVHSRVEECERNMWPYYKKWGLNTEYFADNPFAGWNPNNKTIVKSPNANRRGGGAQQAHPVSYNLFKSACTAIIARFASTRPQIIIKPGSTQEEVVEAARVAQRVVAEHEWERQRMEEVLAESVPNLILHGTSVLKVTWNPKGGKYLGKNPVPAIGEDGNPMQSQVYDPISGQVRGDIDDEGRPVWSHQNGPDGLPVKEHEWEGQAETSVILARDFMVDPTAKAFRTARWCIQKYEMSPTDIYDRWEKTVAFSGEGSSPDQQFNYTRRYDQDSKNTATVYEMWLRPGTYKFGPQASDKVTFSNGFVIICTADTLLDAGPNPYDHGDFPFVFIPALRVPGELYGDTVANSLRMLQNSFNKTGSQIVQANDLAGNPSWLLPNGCKMPDSDRINKAAIFRRYEPGMQNEKPEMIPGTGVGPSVWRYWDSLRALFQEISGVRDGGMGGSTAGGVESGKALEALVERDVSKLAPIGLELGRGLKQWTWLALKVIQQHWDVPRSINVVGHYQVSEVVSFGASDVHDSFEVSVAPESVMPQTAALKQAKAADLLDRQIIKPYDYLKRVGEDSAEEFTTESLDVANARMENASARRHGVIPIMARPEQMQVEDHALHMEEHRRELLNPTLRRDSRKWQSLYDHFTEHERMASGVAEQQLEVTSMQAQAMDPNQGPEMEGPQPTPPPTTGGSY